MGKIGFYGIARGTGRELKSVFGYKRSKSQKKNKKKKRGIGTKTRESYIRKDFRKAFRL